MRGDEVEALSDYLAIVRLMRQLVLWSRVPREVCGWFLGSGPVREA